MPLPNSMNTAKGKDFQTKVAEILSQYYKVEFRTEYPIPIGTPPKVHRFDLVSSDLNYIGESKNYSWTEGGNVPSAKMGFINEAVFYLQHLPKDKKRFVVVRKDINTKRNESLAEYYFRTNEHLLNGIYVVELDIFTRTVREFGL